MIHVFILGEEAFTVTESESIIFAVNVDTTSLDRRQLDVKLSGPCLILVDRGSLLSEKLWQYVECWKYQTNVVTLMEDITGFIPMVVHFTLVCM